MAFTNIAAPNVGDPTKKSFAQAVIDNLSYLFNSVLRILSSDGFENGSFETDVDADGVPDGWALTLSGGAFVLDTTAANVVHGLNSAKFTSTGAGGGYLQYADYFEVTVNRPPVFQWQMKSSTAGVTNKVEVLFYDYAKSFLSSVTIYNNTATNPTAWTLTRGAAVPPATSKYARLKITGANSATAGSTWYDDFQILPQPGINVPSGMQVFTASGTFTVPIGVVKVRAKAWGGGGGGNNTSANTQGGGGGGYAEDVVTVTPGAAITVTVGAGGPTGNLTAAAGGASSFGASVAANGGALGIGTETANGGAGTAGSIQITGSRGRKVTDSGGTNITGIGGFSALGGWIGKGGDYNHAGNDGAVIVEW